jgi:hypothetical protein
MIEGTGMISDVSNLPLPTPLPTIRPTFLADCSVWDKGLIHQIEAWEWLQQHTDPKVLSEFAAKFSPTREAIGVAHESSPLPKKIVVDWNNPECQISKYFTVREVTNGDRRRIPVVGSDVAKNVLALAIELDKIREAWGKPIRVTSWYRPVAVNREIGGASRSKHIGGGAADICPVGGDINDFQDWLDNRWYGRLGYGARRGFVHCDMDNGKGFDDSGEKGVRWNY